MKPQLRRHYITLLIPGIQAIGADFERFGRRFVGYVHRGPLEHRGLDPRDNPVGHTVDTKSSDGSFGAEYSADQQYFEPPYSKIDKDVSHMFKLHPYAKSIHLMSSELKRAHASTYVAELAGRLKRDRDVDLEVWDSRKIAEYIVDELILNDDAVTTLGEYLPILIQISSEFALTQSVPTPAGDRIAQPTLEQCLRDALQGDRVVTLSGLSGSGKSETAAAVARSLDARFDLTIWLSSPIINSVAELSSIFVARRGEHVNVLSTLEDRACLLVLDDLAGDVDLGALKDACGPNSAVLVTRQMVRPGDVEMPFLNRTESRRLLESGAPAPCPDALFSRVWDVVGGHPLTLRLLNAGVREGGWVDLEADIEAVGRYPDADRSRRLADRVLERARGAIPLELAFFAWCESPSVDRSFALKVIRPVGTRSLRRLGFLATTHQDLLRLHDIVWASLTAVEVDVAGYGERFARELEAYATEVAFAEESGLPFRHLCRLHRAMFARLAASDPERDIWLYCLLHAWDIPEIEVALIGDPLERARRVEAGRGPVSDISISTVLEAEEAVYLRRKFDLGRMSAEELRRRNLEVFERLSRAPGISGPAQRAIQHHYAKALRIVGELDEAKRLCEELLAGPDPMAATKLLLARILLHQQPTGSVAAGRLLFDILEEAQAAPDQVSISVLLAVVSELRRGKGWVEGALDQFGDLIADRIVAAASRGVDHAYLTLADIGSTWNWHDREQFRQVLDEIPPRQLSPDLVDQQLVAWGKILVNSREALPPERRAGMLREAVAFFEAVRERDPMVDQEYGKALLFSGRISDARRVFTAVHEQRPSVFSAYWLSQAYFAAGNAESARTLIDQALEENERAADPGKFAATLLAHRFEVRSALKDVAAHEDLVRAIDVCQNDRHRDDLQRRLDGLELT